MPNQDPSQPGELTRDEVAEVANLALLELTDEELETYTGQLGAILQRARDLEALDLEGVPPTAHPYPLVNVFRSDAAEVLSDVRAEALAAAPEIEDGRYKVPPALGEEP